MKLDLKIKKQPLFLFWCFALFLSFSSFTGFAQVNYVTWNFTTSITNANYSTNFTNQTAARSSALTAPTLSTISLTGTTGTVGNTLHRSTGWPTTQDNNKYAEFTITLASGQTFPNTTMNLLVAAGVSSITTAARNYQVQYGWGASPTFIAVSGTNAANAVATSGGTVTTLLTSQTSNNATILAPGNTTTTVLKIRLVGYGSTSTTGNIQFGSIVLTATTAPLTVSAPTLATTAAPLSLTAIAATLGGNVTATGGASILSNGIVYSATDTTPTIGESGVIQLATAVPGSGTGSFSDATGNVLSVNTLYTYNAYASNSSGFGYGSPTTFYTLANRPFAPTLSNATVNSMQIVIDTGDGNPSTTEYAIEVNGSGNYVQSNGSSTGSAVWLRASVWGTKTITSLTSNTSYSFRVYARNGANVITAFGPQTTLSTLSPTVPSLEADPLATFGSLCINTTSPANSFTFLGTNLTSSVTVGPLTGFSFSTISNGSYTSSLSYTPDGNGAIVATVFVKFSPILVQSYTSTSPATSISITGGGATAISVAVSGSGIDTPATVITGSFSARTSTGVTLAGSYSLGCSSVNASGFEYGLSNVLASYTTVSGQPATLTDLEPNTVYYYRAIATDNTGIVRGLILSFTTAQLDAPIADTANSISYDSFTANWQSVRGATGYQLDVSTASDFLGASVTVATWNFPNATDDNSIDGGITANAGKTLTTQGGIGVIAYVPVSSSTTSAASGNTWNSGSGTKFWQIDIATTGHYNIKLSSVQRSSATGPRDFKVQYKIGADVTWIDIAGASVTTANNWTSGVLTNVVLPTICDNQPSVFIRWIMTSNTSVGNPTPGTVASTGTSGIDSIVITGSAPSFVSGYESLAVTGLSHSVNGPAITGLTTFYYRVRATSTNSISANSNQIAVLTTAAPPTFDSVSLQAGAICDGANGTFDVNGLLPGIASRIYFDIGGGITQSVLTTVADGSGFATFVLPLTVINNGQILTVTSVERPDVTAPILTVTSNNQVFLTGIAPNVTYYQDSDGDTYGNLLVTQLTCVQPVGYVSNNTDCDDTNINIYQFATFYVDADLDTYGSLASASVCSGLTTPSGYSTNNTDCNDADATKHSSFPFYVDGDLDGYGAGSSVSLCAVNATTPPSGYSLTNDDCDDTNALLNPTNPCSTSSIVNLKLFVQGYYTGAGTMALVSSQSPPTKT